MNGIPATDNIKYWTQGRSWTAEDKQERLCGRPDEEIKGVPSKVVPPKQRWELRRLYAGTYAGSSDY